jgi:hypothetical protein
MPCFARSNSSWLSVPVGSTYSGFIGGIGVKIGFRTPSLKRSLKARTTGRLTRAVKRSVNPFYGRKGVGLITNPKRSLYNAVYHRTTFGVSDVVRAANCSGRSSASTGNQSCLVHLLLLVTTFGIGNIIYAVIASAAQSSHGTSDAPSPRSSQRYVLRGGRSVPADEVFEACASGDFERMRRALDLPTNWIDRHFLLLALIQESYRQRADPERAAECARLSEMHLAEFAQIAPELLREFGSMPRVPTFQHYATVLTEQGDYDRAVWVCELAKHYRLDDGTKSGFDGRIARIRKKQAAVTG